MNDIPADGARVPPPKRSDFTPKPKLEAPAGVPALSGIRIGCDSLENFEFSQRVARVWTMNEMVPLQYRHLVPSKSDRTQLVENPTALGNAMVAIDMAVRLRTGVLQIMQNLYVIEGRPSFKSEFLIGLVNECGRFSQLRWDVVEGPEIEVEYTTSKWEGPQGQRRKVDTTHKVRIPDTKWRAWARDLDTGDRLDGPWISMRMAVAEGWFGKEGSKWQTIPDLMGRYRAGAWWQRLYAPQLTAGYPTMEEQEDVIDARRTGPDSYDATETVRHVHTPPAQSNPGQEMPAQDSQRNRAESSAQASETAEQSNLDQEETGDEGAGFEANLIDTDGCIIGEPFTDAFEFIEALIALASKSHDPQALLEHNEGAIADARDADVLAQVAYDEWRNLPPPPPKPITFADLKPVMLRGKPDWQGYVARLTKAMDDCPAARFNDFLTHHRAVMESAPASTRLALVKAIALRSKAFGLGAAPGWTNAMMKPTQPADENPEPAKESPAEPTPEFSLTPPTKTPWPDPEGMKAADWVAQTVTWLSGLTDNPTLRTFIDDEGMRERRRWLTTNRKELADILDVAVRDAHERLQDT